MLAKPLRPRLLKSTRILLGSLLLLLSPPRLQPASSPQAMYIEPRTSHGYHFRQYWSQFLAPNAALTSLSNTS
ncbi:hypothetical protein V8C42DRAFT_323478 [Trichoderma barbatum]